jgi:hypothetical protein
MIRIVTALALCLLAGCVSSQVAEYNRVAAACKAIPVSPMTPRADCYQRAADQLPGPDLPAK